MTEDTSQDPDDDSRGVTRRNVIAAAGVAVSVVVVGKSVVAETVENVEEMKEHCDEKHGEGEWVLAQANRSEREPWSIGQQHVCVHENSTKAEENHV